MRDDRLEATNRTWLARLRRPSVALRGFGLACGGLLGVACGSSGSGPVTSSLPYLAVEWTFPSADGSVHVLGTWNPGDGSMPMIPSEPLLSSLPERPSISADGTRIAFDARPWGGGASSKIFSMWNTGASPKQVTSGDPARSDSYASWSPDGKRLVFSSELAGDSGLWTCDSDGFYLSRLTTAPAGDLDYDPHWSPDGTKVLFVRTVGGEGQVWVMDANGQDQRQLTSANFHDNVEPDWASDSKRFVWVSSGVNDEEHRVWLASIDGSTPVTQIDPIPYGSGTDHWCPRWGRIPSGERIFFILVCHLSAPYDCPDEIWSIRPDGTDLKQEVVPFPQEAAWIDAHG